MTFDPASAPPRPDLTFLRRRSRPAPPPPTTTANRSESGSAVADFFAGHSTSSEHEQSAMPTISFDRPGRKSATLDLSDDPQPTTTPPPSPTRPIRGERVSAGRQHLLSVADPTVLLSRIQSGVGTLEIAAAVSGDVGDLRLGAAYELRSGHTSIVQLAGEGNRFAPSSRRPVIVAGRDEFDHLRIDLRQVRELERMAVYAVSESRTELTWGGTLVVSTAGGARIELPLESLYPGRVAVLVSLYNVDAEIVVRAEMETIAGDVREAARAYGYDRITWRDDRNPVDP